MKKERQKRQILRFLNGKNTAQVDAFTIYQWIDRCYFEQWWELAGALGALLPPNSLTHQYHKRVEYILSECRKIESGHLMNRSATQHKTVEGGWYTINGQQGMELPTFFSRCIKSLREYGTVDVTLRKGIEAEDTIVRFKRHPGYERFMMKYKPLPRELEEVFAAIRSAKLME